MKKILLLIAVLLWAGQAWALPSYTGELTSVTNGGLDGFGGWASGASFSWNITSSVTSGTDYYTWKYDYTWVDDSKDLSNIIIQVSDTFTLANILPGTTKYEELKEYKTSKIPELPTDVYGIKFESLNDLDKDEDSSLYKFTIVTDRAPMWGNIYVKDGVDGSVDTYAYNSGFDSGLTTPVFDPMTGISTLSSSYSPVSQPGPVFTGADGISTYGWALVPDTRVIYDDGGGGGGGGASVVPEPGTLVLVGAGLVGLALLRRKQNK